MLREFCPGCGAVRSEGASFCASCGRGLTLRGHATPVTPPPPGPTPEPRRSHRQLPATIVAVAFMLVAATAAVLLLVVHNGHPGSAKTYAESVNTQLAPVRKTDHQLAVALAAAEQPRSLNVVATAAGSVSSAVTRAQGAIGILPVPASQPRTARYLNDALASNLFYAQRVETAVRSLNSASAAAAAGAAGAARIAYKELVAANVALDVPSGRSFEAMNLTTLAAKEAAQAKNKSESFADLVAHTRSGVVEIDVNTCDGSVSGTGFLIGPQLVATADHVVDGATSITLMRNGAYLTSATVVGSDPIRDLALLRTAQPINGYRFRLASRAPRIGEQVAALGFPLGLPLTFTRGSISGLGRTEPIEGTMRQSLVQTDTAVNPGNSGGPLMTENGEVIGLVDATDTEASGISFAVSALVARPLLAAWKSSPQAQALGYCGSPTVAAPPLTAAPAAPSASTEAVAATVREHWKLIDAGDYSDAYALFSPRLQGAGRPERMDRRQVARSTPILRSRSPRRHVQLGDDRNALADLSHDRTRDVVDKHRLQRLGRRLRHGRRGRRLAD